MVILVETEKEKTLRKEYVFADSKVSDHKALGRARRGVREAWFLRLAGCLEVGTRYRQLAQLSRPLPT